MADHRHPLGELGKRAAQAATDAQPIFGRDFHELDFGRDFFEERAQMGPP